MHWIALSEKDTANDQLEKRLWETADQLRANSGLTAQQYSGPVLGLIFLRFAEVRFAKRRAELEKQATGSRRGSRVDEATAYHAGGILFLAPEGRFGFLLSLPEGANIGSKLNDAMRAIERDNPQLAGVLPKSYELFSSPLLKQLLKRVSEIPASLDYDAFGRIYEYFLGEFARTEGSKGGEFYTPAVMWLMKVEPFLESDQRPRRRAKFGLLTVLRAPLPWRSFWRRTRGNVYADSWSLNSNLRRSSRAFPHG